MSGEDFLDIPKTDETQQSTPEEYYFSKSKQEWIMVSDMSDMHVRRAFKRLLKMIRLGSLVELSDYTGNKKNIKTILQEIDNIESHCEKNRGSTYRRLVILNLNLTKNLHIKILLEKMKLLEMSIKNM